MLNLSTMRERFESCVAKLKNFGFEGRVFVNKDGVFIVCYNKSSSSLIKNAMKDLSKESGENTAFYSPRGTQIGFFCYTTNGTAKKTVKVFAEKELLPPDHPFARFTLPCDHAPLRATVKVDGKIIDMLEPVKYWKTDILDRFPSVAELQEKGYGFYHTKDFPKCLDLSKLIVFRPASEVFLGLVIKLYEGAEHHAK